MKKRSAIVGLVLVGVAVAVYAAIPSAGAATGKIADAARFDSANDASIFCSGTGPFNVYLSFESADQSLSTTLRVTFQNGDFVQHGLNPDRLFALQHVAGTSRGVDRKVVVTTLGTQVTGWMKRHPARGHRYEGHLWNRRASTLGKTRIAQELPKP